MRGNVFVSDSGTPGLVLARWRVEKRGMARLSVESIRHAKSQRK